MYLYVVAVAEQEKALARLEEKYSRIQLTKVVEKYGTPKVREENRRGGEKDTLSILFSKWKWLEMQN